LTDSQLSCYFDAWNNVPLWVHNCSDIIVKKTLLRFYVFISVFLLSATGNNLGAQSVNDYRTIASGVWTNSAIWETWNGSAWVATTWPSATTASVFISAGHTVTLPTPGPYNLSNLTVENGAKLFSNQGTQNVYINVLGSNIVCDGEIGNGATFDGIAFNFDGVATTISGVGTFTSSRFRKNATTNLITSLIVAMNVTLRWDQVSNTQLYNNTTGSSRFNVTVNFGYTLHCAGSPTQPGNLTIDGVSGTGAYDAGGTVTVNGTLIVPGIIYACSNNPNNIPYTTGSGTAGTNTITVSQTTGLAVGQRVVGTGIAPNATITAIVGTTVTLSINNTGAVTGAVTILPSTAPSISGSVGQSTITVSSSAGLYVGQSISGTNIASGASITAISGTTITLSAPNIGAVSGYATVGNSCNFIVGNGGVIKAGAVYSPTGPAAGFMNFTVKTGGKLELTGTTGFPAGTANWSTINNRYNFETGSTVEYSAAGNQSVLIQSDFVSSVSQNQYWHLIISGSGVKTIRAGLVLTIRGDLTITGGIASLDQLTNGTDIAIGGNWSNYNLTGFNESINAAKSVKFYGSQAVQTIMCPSGERFYNLWIAKTGNTLVRMINDVFVVNQLTLGQGNGIQTGILQLNKNTLTLESPSTAAIKLIGSPTTAGGSNYRYIVAEDSTGGCASMVKWKIGTGTGLYVIPFGINSTLDTIPFYINKQANDAAGELSVATYGTPASNLPWPTAPAQVTNLLANNPIYNTPDNRDWTVDRFWYIGTTGGSSSSCDVTFTYNNRSGTELPTSDPVPGNLLAQFWNGNAIPNPSWNLPQMGTASVSPYPITSVTVTSLPISNNTAWTLSSLTSPLPIELLRFDARSAGDRVAVSWVTATEINNDYFTVERSRDGESFEAIGSRKGAGNSSVEQYYTFLDASPLAGISYYRLRQTDFDGKFSYSETVAVDLHRKASSLFSLSPNPSSSWSEITVNEMLRENVTMTISDMSGRTVFSGQFNPAETPTFPIDLTHFSKGVYSVIITGVSVNDHFRLVKE